MNSRGMNQREHDITVALGYLRSARDLLKQANAPQATEAVRKAMKSVEGAKRHASADEFRQARS